MAVMCHQAGCNILRIKWYHNGAVQTNGIRQTTTTNTLEGTDTFRSILSLTDLQPASNSGEYYCQATVDSSNLLPSESFILSNDKFAYINFVECINMNAYLSTATKCGDRHDDDKSTSFPQTIQPTLCASTETSNLYTLAVTQRLTVKDFKVIQTLCPTENASTQTDTASV